MKSFHIRFSLWQMLVWIAAAALMVALMIHWITRYTQKQRIETAEMWIAEAEKLERRAEEFWDAAWNAQMDFDPLSARILEAASLVCLKRAEYRREWSLYWRIAADSSPDLPPPSVSATSGKPRWVQAAEDREDWLFLEAAETVLQARKEMRSSDQE